MKGVLKSFLFPTDFYADDVADMVGNCVQRHGEEEWRAVTLTNEIHGHLGIYSTLGAKMGLLARELFREEGVKEMSVLSFAGSVPPVSCLNDGLQVSTGASMGHGCFALSSAGEETSVKARFMGEGKVLELCLKPEWLCATGWNGTVPAFFPLPGREIAQTSPEALFHHLCKDDAFQDIFFLGDVFGEQPNLVGGVGVAVLKDGIDGEGFHRPASFGEIVIYVSRRT